MKIPQFAPILVFCLSASALPAAVTYIDATMANTDNAAGGADSTWLDGNDASVSGAKVDGAANSDGLWRYRQGSGSDGIFEATGSSTQAENAVPIVTSISGLADGTYDIYVFFRASTSTGENWNIKADLTPTLADSDIYRQNDTRGLSLGTVGIGSMGLTFTLGSEPVAGEGRALLYGIVGQAIVSGGDDVKVYIDDLPALAWPGASTAGSTVRTWYDGVGYELVPEPSAALLGVFGALTLLVRRRC